MKRTWKALVAGGLGLAVLALGLAAPAEAQVQKSGKAKFRTNNHFLYVVQKFPDGQLSASGSIQGIQLNGAGEGFGHELGFECSIYIDIKDLANGVFPLQVYACIYRDKDGDAIFTKSSCSTSSWDDWCGGRIVAGTGKYAGITGTTRDKGDGGIAARRHCIVSAKPEDCQATYPSAGKVPAGVTYTAEVDQFGTLEWEWKIP
jgi:hypothetical protein